MNNKLGALLILIMIFSGIYFFYYYFFVLNKGNLTLAGNIGGYEVSLYNENLKTAFKSSCVKSECELIDIAPFQYTMTISKDGYKPYSQNIQIIKKGTLYLDFYLEKQLNIKKMEEVTTVDSSLENSNSGLTDTARATALEKISELRKIKDLQSKYKFYDFGILGYFYFEESSDGTITLFRSLNTKDVKIYSLPKLDKDLVDLFFIENSNNFLFLKYDKKAYIFDLGTGTNKEFEFGPKVNYVKKDTNIVSIVTDVGTYLYDLNTDKLEYFTFFKDFLYYGDDSYFGVIFEDENDKKKNYNLENKSNNLIVKYNFKTKGIKVLEQTRINVKKILHEGDDIYFYDENNIKYLVDNID